MFDKLAVFVTLLVTFAAAMPMSSPDTLLKCFEGTSQCCASVKHVIRGNATRMVNVSLYGDLMAAQDQAGMDCTQFDVFIDPEDGDRPSCDSEALLACCDDNTLVKGVDGAGIPTEGIACRPLVQAVTAGF